METKEKPTTEAKTYETSASYQVNKITFVVERVFREKAESVIDILARRICRDTETQ